MTSRSTFVALATVAISLISGGTSFGQDKQERGLREFHSSVAGYKEACAGLAARLKDERSLVVWLFDQSESMRDDQAEIRKLLPKFFEELGQPLNPAAEKLADDSTVYMSVMAFGKSMVDLTRKPTSTVARLTDAINRIPKDESGVENTCRAVHTAIQKYARVSQSAKRKLVIVVVTDESPSDHAQVEQVIVTAKRQQATCIVMGREATFGTRYGHVRWIDPKFRLAHWIQIDRGPETASPEILQYNGFGRRYDSFGSGFGPYSLVRLAKESRGHFYVLPSFDALRTTKSDDSWKTKYAPEHSPQREHEQAINKSRFRNTIIRVVRALNPQVDRKLVIRSSGFSVDADSFRKQAIAEFERAASAIKKLDVAIEQLETLTDSREAEPSLRWRANYDLTLAQCRAFRVRLIQFLLAADKHAESKPQPKNSKSNQWNIARNKTVATPDADAYSRLKKVFSSNSDRDEFVLQLENQVSEAVESLQYVVKQHPGTPWAKMAQFELQSGMGIRLVEAFRDPRYKNFSKSVKPPIF